MRKVLAVGSILATTLLILTSLPSVVGTKDVTSDSLSKYLREKPDDMSLIGWINYIIGMVLLGTSIGGLMFVYGLGLPGIFLDEIFLLIGIIAMIFLGMGGGF